VIRAYLGDKTADIKQQPMGIPSLMKEVPGMSTSVTHLIILDGQIRMRLETEKTKLFAVMN
jgi:hypothetical protein